jgi:PKD repeat protein
MNIIKIVRIKKLIKLSYLISGFALIFFLAGTIQPASATKITASREISTGTVYAGGTFTVTVHIKADEQVEALTLDENLPEGWNMSMVGNDGSVFQGKSTFKDSTQEWIWVESLSAGEEKTITYYVTVPPSSNLGISNIYSTVSAYSIPASSVRGSSAITVNSPLPVAGFTAIPLSGPAPLTVQFNESSTNVTGWSWNFGDGISSTEQNPTHIFSTVGNYTVNLTVSNGNGADSKLATITVSSAPSIPVLPGYTNPPTDPNHDGYYKDINGNKIEDFDDIVAYYDNMDWIGENAPIALFDYNKNGLVDFDDVVKLYDML